MIFETKEKNKIFIYFSENKYFIKLFFRQFFN